MSKLKKWFWNVMIGIDQLANAILMGDPDETISSRIGKEISENKCPVCKLICKVLDVIDPRGGSHCKQSIEADEGKDSV